MLTTNKNYLEIAELIHLIISDQTINNSIIENQTKRLAYFDDKATKKKLKTYIENIV